MVTLQKIEIDFEVHKLIEAERRSFAEAPYVALRRLLALPEKTNGQRPETWNSASCRPFVEAGVSIPHGSKARMKYLRGSQVYEGEFFDGVLAVNGHNFHSLSAAAKTLAVSRKGTSPSLNGWLYWEAKFPNESHWRNLDDLRNSKSKRR